MRQICCCQSILFVSCYMDLFIYIVLNFDSLFNQKDIQELRAAITIFLRSSGNFLSEFSN